MVTIKKIAVLLMAVALLVSFATAANVTIDGERFEGARIVDSVTYVPLRAYCGEFSGNEISWDNDLRLATITSDELLAGVKIGDCYIEANGRIVYSGKENIIIDGSTYIPIRSISKVLGATVDWDNETKTAIVVRDGESFESADSFYNSSDLYWLSKIINAESEGEPLEGKIAVGNVVLNRVRNPEFPDNVYDVVFDRKGGVQFTPVANGAIYNQPNDESILAAKICLEDYNLTSREILFFLNPETSVSAWIPNNRDFVVSIGRHDFYA